MMDPRTGLLPGQSWNVAPSESWQARIDAKGYAHCIGETLARHSDYVDMYYTGNGVVDHDRSWVDFDSAMNQARRHNAAIAAKRQAAQAGQGEG
jgi:hypothetical protein